MGNTRTGSRIQWQSKDKDRASSKNQATCVAWVNQLLFTSYHSTFARLVYSSQFRSGWQKKCQFMMSESLFPMNCRCQLEVAFTQTSTRDRKKQFEKRFISPQKIHLNKVFPKKCAFFSLDWDETSEQSAHVQPSKGQGRESWCRCSLPSRRKLPISLCIFSSWSGLPTEQKLCTTPSSPLPEDIQTGTLQLTPSS